MGLELLFGVALGCAVSFFEAFLGRLDLDSAWWQAVGSAVLWRHKALGGILEDVIKDLAYPLTAIWSFLNIDDTRTISEADAVIALTDIEVSVLELFGIVLRENA